MYHTGSTTTPKYTLTQRLVYSYSCLNVYVKAELDKKNKACIQVTSMWSSFLCYQFANLQHNNVACQK